MKYRLTYTNRAVKDIKRLDPGIKKQINGVNKVAETKAVCG